MTEEVYLSQFWWSWTWCLNWLRSREDVIATTVTMVGATDGASGYISNRKRRMLGWPNLGSCNKALKSTEEFPTEGLLLGAINDSRPSVRPLLQGSPTSTVPRFRNLCTPGTADLLKPWAGSPHSGVCLLHAARSSQT